MQEPLGGRSQIAYLAVVTSKKHLHRRPHLGVGGCVSVGFRCSELGLRQCFDVSLERRPEDKRPAATLAGTYMSHTKLTLQL
jgi:hypothetical protein